MKVQEAYRTPNRLDQKKIPLPYNNQNTKHTEQRKNNKICKTKSSDVGLVKIISHSVGCLFVLMTISFALRKNGRISHALGLGGSI